MKLLLSILCAILTSSFAFAGVIGTYTGEMVITTDGKSTTTELTSVVTKDGIQSKFDNIDYTVSFSAPADGFYNVSVGGAVVGNGHCIEMACHYSFTSNGMEFNETIIRLSDDEMIRTGSNTDSNGKVSLFYSRQVK